MDQHTIYMLISGAIFVLAYALIISEKIDRTIVALSGAALMILVRILNQEEAFKAIDFNTIGLLISMMAIVMITKRTGVFEYLAVKTVKIARGGPFRIIIYLSIITGVLSAFLDNVTTILLILPVTLSVTKDLKISPIPFIIAEVFASNVGGTATLIGDPPNIMIGSSAGLNFMDFVYNLTPIILPMLFVTTYVFALSYKKKLKTDAANREKVMQMNEAEMIKDPVLLVKSLVVLGLTIIGFVLHGTLHYESGTIAIAGAVLLALISKINPEKIFKEVEWKTIFFFTGLFMLVGGIEATGIIKLMAQEVLELTKGNAALTMMAILWVSAIASAFIDNIPFVATMIPMIKDLGALSGMNILPLWWALSLGACLGGNGTIIGASANVVASGMAEEAGHKITFGRYFKIAFPVMLLTIILCTVYLYFRYLG